MRNWRLILADAKARELSPGEVAREQGCRIGNVYHAMHQHQIGLAQAALAIRRAQFKTLAPGLTLNGVCIALGVAQDTAKRWARKTGYRFAHASKGRAIRGQAAIMER